MTDDQTHMRRAIALAHTNLGRTAENPSVGCVIVKHGAILGEGATGEGGRPHAEEVALAGARDAVRGATAYVTLEPCGERSSGAPSCSEIMVAAGLARVVVACEDPSPMASGLGIQRLRAAGIDTDLGLCAAEANALYTSYAPDAITRPQR